MANRDPYLSRRGDRSGTARRDAYGRRIPGEVNEYDRPMGTPAPAPAGTGLTGQAPPTAFDRKFTAGPATVAPVIPQISTTTTAPRSPALAAAGAAASMVSPMVGSAMMSAGSAPVTTTKTAPAPDAFGSTRRTSTGGAEVFQRSETSGTGGRWTPTTAMHPVMPGAGTVTDPGTSTPNWRGISNVRSVSPGGVNNDGSAYAPSAGVGQLYDPRHDLGITKVANTAPGATRTVQIDPRYVTPNTATTGYITPGAGPNSNATAGRIIGKEGDETAATMQRLGTHPADAFSRGVVQGQPAAQSVGHTMAPASMVTAPTLASAAGAPMAPVAGIPGAEPVPARPVAAPTPPPMAPAPSAYDTGRNIGQAMQQVAAPLAPAPAPLSAPEAKIQGDLAQLSAQKTQHDNAQLDKVRAVDAGTQSALSNAVAPDPFADERKKRRAMATAF